jgi:hypothetical protein
MLNRSTLFPIGSLHGRVARAIFGLSAEDHNDKDSH